MLSLGVVIPTRNYERFLPDALASLRNQIEHRVIVVDDYSADPAAVQRAAGDVPVIHLPAPSGIGLARNVGAAILNTDCFLFLDADDVLQPDALERLMRPLAYQVVDFTYGNFLERGMLVRTPEWREETLRQQNVASYCNLWRRKAFWQIGGYSTVPVAEDWEIQRRAMAAGLVGLHVSATIFEHRLHAENKWTQDAQAYGGLEGVSKILDDWKGA